MTFQEDCCEHVDHSRVHVEERGRSATFLNDERTKYTKVRYDGCVCTGQLAADWVVEKTNCGQVIVELKGRDIEHGFKQINATAAYLRENDLRKGRIGALLVASQIPKISTTIQRAKQSFAKEFGGKLVVKSNKCSLRFDSIC